MNRRDFFKLLGIPALALPVLGVLGLKKATPYYKIGYWYQEIRHGWSHHWLWQEQPIGQVIESRCNLETGEIDFTIQFEEKFYRELISGKTRYPSLFSD